MPAGGKPRLLAKRAQQPTLTDLQYVVQVRARLRLRLDTRRPRLCLAGGTSDSFWNDRRLDSKALTAG